MATVAAHGIAAQLPGGFEARIFRRTPGPGERSFPVAHFASFAIPTEVGDFGAGAVTLMGPTDVFAVLFEYGPESVGRKLFERQGIPAALSEGDFRPYVVRRGLPGHAGTQWFFTEAGRPFTLYVVLGSFGRRGVLVPKVNELLANLSIAPAASTAASVQRAGVPGPDWN